MESAFEQVPFGAHKFADNPEPRCPCLLLLDNSGSMAGQPLAELNAGLVQFKDELAADFLLPSGSRSPSFPWPRVDGD